MADETTTEASALVSSIQDRVADTFRELTPIQRSVLVLRYYQGLDLTTISIDLEVSINTVRVAHREAIEVLHSAMRSAAS